MEIALLITLFIAMVLAIALYFVNDKRDRAVFMGRMYYSWYCDSHLQRVKDSSLIKAQKEYIELLGNEIDDLVGIARVHGWESNNVEQGEFLREQIQLLQ